MIGYQYDSVYEMYNQLVTILDPMLASLKYFHNDVGRATIYVDKDMIKHGDTLAPISEIIDTDWYKSVANSGEMQWFVDKNEGIVFGASPMSMLKRYGLDGILYISVDYDSMFETFKQTLQNNYGIVIFDEKGNAVYEKAFFDKHPYLYIFTPQQNYRCEIFSIHSAKDLSASYDLNYPTKESWQQYLNMVEGLSDFKRNVKLNTQDHIVTLSTCSYEEGNSTDLRYLLHAKLVKWDGSYKVKKGK